MRNLHNVGECPPPLQFMLCNEALLPFKAELFPPDCLETIS